MDKSWWIAFSVGAFLGYQMKIAASNDIQNKVAAIDGGLMIGAVIFFMQKLLVFENPNIADHLTLE